MDRNHHIFIAASLSSGASISMILPLLAPLIREMNMAEWQGGALISAGALFMAIAAVYISKRHQVMSIFQLLSVGFIGMTVTWAIFAILLSYGMYSHTAIGLLFILLLIVRAFSGVFMAMPQIALQSFVMTQYTNEHQRSQTMAKFGALNSSGLILGPLLTTLLITWGLLTPLWFSLIIFVAISVYIVWGFERTTTQSSHSMIVPSNEKLSDDSTQQKGSAAEVQADLNPLSAHEFIHAKVEDLEQIKDSPIAQSIVWSKAAIWFALGLNLYTLIVTVNLTAGFYIQDHFLVTPQQSAVYFSQCSLIVGISLVCMQVAISKLLQWSVQRLLWIGLMSMVLALLMTLFAPHIRIFQLAYVLYGVAVACLLPAFTTGAAQSAPQHLQTKIASLCTATQAIGFVFAPLLSTLLYHLDKTLPYVLLLILMVVLMGCFTIHFIRANRSIKRC